MVNNKAEIISKIYNDLSGFGSIQQTFQEARKIDKTITLADVQEWKEKNIVRKTNLPGYNSYVASAPRFEYQVDPFYVNLGEQKFKYGMLAVDIFTKQVEVVPMMLKDKDNILAAFYELFKKLGGNPKMVYSDNDTAIDAPIVQKWFEDQGIKHITTRTHAAQAERQIRTFKDMLEKITENNPEEKPWTDFIYPILLTYNHKMKSSITKFTPHEAKQTDNHMDVKINLELHAKKKRKYPDINVGDYVRVYQKKKIFDKERVPRWTTETYKVDNISEDFGQKFYKVADWTKPFIRHEILKV